MKKVITIAILLLSVFKIYAENLLRNGDFEQENYRMELRTDWVANTNAVSLFTEEYTWNKCLKLEVQKMDPDEQNVRKVYALLLLGADGNLPGFKVKPETSYQVSLELRGTVSGANLRPAFWNNESKETWPGLRFGTIEPSAGIKVSPKWSRIQGRFKTAADTRRAALGISLWGDSSKQSNFSWEIGQQLLIDNVVIRELRHLEDPSSTAQLSQTVLDRKVISLPAEKNSGFLNYQTGSPAEQDSFFSIRRDAQSFHIEVDCPQTATVRAQVSSNGIGIWADDVVEIFFGPSTAKDRLLSQFAIAAGGGRYMGDGVMVLNDYESWQAKTEVDEKGWRLQVTIPFKALGYVGEPASGELLAFNICRQRQGELSSWSPVRNGFHDVNNYHFLLLGEKKAFAQRVLAELGDCPPELQAEQDVFAAAEANPTDLYRQSIALIKRRFDFRLGSSTYLLGRAISHGDFSLPFNLLPEMLLFEDKPVLLRAAVNEQCPLPLIISNRSENIASYRVVVHPNLPFSTYERAGLEKDFPGEQIEMYEGIPMKDGDNEPPTLRFDALPRMNQANIVTVAPGGTALIWVNFDCRDILPGNYKGAIRVMPLTEAAEMVNNIKYIGNAKDFPLELEILPIELPMQEPELPCWLMTRGESEDIYRTQAELGGRMLLVNPWSFRYAFNEEGEISSDLIIPAIVESVRERLAWQKKYGFRGGLKIFVHFGAYTVFEKQFLNKKIVVGSPAWSNAWKNNLLGIAANMRECGLKNNEWGIEIFDEPSGKDIERDLEVCRLAHDTLPDIFLSITWAASNFGHTPDSIRRFFPYLNDHCFWHGHLNNPAYRQLATEIRESGKTYSFYACSTSMRENLYRYFRLHAWKGYEFGAKVIGLYVFNNGPHGTPGTTNWKISSNGGISYRSGDQCIRTIRMEAFRQGLTDIAYLGVLKKLAVDDSKIAREARAFLKQAPKDAVYEQIHDQETVNKLRNQAIDYILALLQ